MSKFEFEKILKERVGETCGGGLPRRTGFAENGLRDPAPYREGGRP